MAGDADIGRLPDAGVRGTATYDDSFGQYRLGAPSVASLRVAESRPNAVLVADQQQGAETKPGGDAALQTNPSREKMHELQITESLGMLRGTPEDVGSLTTEDFKNIGDIARALKDGDFQKFDSILSQYDCSQDHLRAIMQGTNLWLRQVGLRNKYVIERGSSTSEHATTHTYSTIVPETGHEIGIDVQEGVVAVDVWPFAGGTTKPLHHFETDRVCG